MRHIELNFINRSNSQNHGNIVLYQLNEASMNHSYFPTAWKVIENCGINECHSFTFDPSVHIVVGDSYGNYKEPLEAQEGRFVEISQGVFGAELKYSNKGPYNPNEYGVVNALRDGSYHVHCFRNDRVLGTIEYVYPKEEALFRFSDIINIGIFPDAEEGYRLETSYLDEIEAQFDLSGIESADIVMTGGGEGVNAQPFEFSLENIKFREF